MSSFTEEWLAQRNREVLGIGVEPPAPVLEDLPKDLRPEWMIQEECVKLLQEDGWRHLRTDPVSDRGRGKGFGEVGMADSLMIRYVGSTPEAMARDLASIREATMIGCVDNLCELMWLEWKAASGKPTSKQIEWHRNERARGALTLIAGVDFPASIAGFTDWYAKSGLKRRA